MKKLKPIFPAGMILTQNISSMEEADRYALKWNLDHLALSRKSFSARFDFFHTNNIQLSLANYALQFSVHGEPPPHCITFVLPVDDTTMLSKKDTITNQHIVIMEPGDEMNAVLFEATQNINVSINRKLFIHRYEKHFNEPYPINEKYALRIGEVDVLEIVKKTLLNILSGAHANISTFYYAENMQAIENTIINNMLLLLGTSSTHLSKSKPVDIAYSLYNAIEMSYTQDIDINTLCTELNISRSNAYLTFKNRYKLTPKQYLDLLRLNNVKKTLQFADPKSIQVGQVAMMNGFYHMGNFAKLYKNFFHELPSTTLHKNKQ